MSVEKRFIDEFTNRTIDNAEQLHQFDLRLKRVEKYLGMRDNVKSFMCFKCNDYIGRPEYHGFDRTLYCDKCDRLVCYKHYCRHLREFVNK